MIIPQKITAAKDDMYDIGTDSDTSDDDEEDELKNRKEDIPDDKIGAKELYDTFERVLKKKYNQKYTKIEIDNKKDFCVQNISQYIKVYIDGKSGRRVSILIDRRTTPNTMYIYCLPEGKNVIPYDFCLVTLVYMCANYVLPIWNAKIEKAEKFPFVGGIYPPVKLFQVSYQMINDDQTRLQWNFTVYSKFCIHMYVDNI